jgi:hypothetical protein
MNVLTGGGHAAASLLLRGKSLSITLKSAAPGRKSRNHFDAAEARTSLVKKISESENAAFDTLTAKLKALRLAKEDADKAEFALKPPSSPSKKKSMRPG